MVRPLVGGLLVLATVTACHAGGAYVVTNTANAGAGSLRWAITETTALGGEGSIVTFAASLKGKTIKPTSVLPAITRADVSVIGNIDQDGTPDIQLDGSLLPRGGPNSGLTVLGAPHCTIAGLAIVDFPASGITATNANVLRVFDCHLGVNLAGTAKRTNDFADMHLAGCASAFIGGWTAPERNVFSGGDSGASPPAYGLVMWDCSSCDVAGNYFGLTRGGLTAFGGGEYGVALARNAAGCTSNSLTTNVFAGVRTGVRIVGVGSDLNHLQSNWFGLAADGQTVLPGMDDGVRIYGGATGNVIGDPADGNVFAGSPIGVRISGAGTVSNAVQSNWFGLDAGGIQVAGVRQGVVVQDAGSQAIGGAAAAAGNLFAIHEAGATTYGVKCLAGATGSLVRFNRFGLLTTGAVALPTTNAVLIDGANVDVVDNVFVGHRVGLDFASLGADGRVLRNRFRNCTDTAVRLRNGARATLGDLNSQVVGEGRNVFLTTNLWNIRNETPYTVRAEGNDFSTTAKGAIDAKIWDRLDDATLGRVDFVPLKGGIIPTGGTEGAAVVVSGAVAEPTSRGAEIAFSLSAPANVTVEVLNLAGRPVAVLAQDRPADSGSQRLVWNGQSASGTTAPSGRYLVRVSARAGGGLQATALVPLTLPR